MGEALIAAVGGHRPQIAADAFVAPTAVVLGRVTLGARASVWYHAVLRGDAESISIGEDTNIQDQCTVHADPAFPAVIGSRVSVGHNVVLHGCTIEDDVLIGMGAVVLNGAHVASGALVAAGAVVRPGMQVPSGVLVAGVPAEVRRELTDAERASIKDNAKGYLLLAEAHRTVEPVSPGPL